MKLAPLLLCAAHVLGYEGQQAVHANVCVRSVANFRALAVELDDVGAIGVVVDAAYVEVALEAAQPEDQVGLVDALVDEGKRVGANVHSAVLRMRRFNRSGAERSAQPHAAALVDQLQCLLDRAVTQHASIDDDDGVLGCIDARDYVLESRLFRALVVLGVRDVEWRGECGTADRLVDQVGRKSNVNWPRLQGTALTEERIQE